MSNIMVAKNIDNTDIEIRIIEAANKVFLKNGVDATTMGQIAVEAGISRTSLNYYFRSKSHIVKQVLENLKDKIIPTISTLIDDEKINITVKIEMFVDSYIDLISKYPLIPAFIIWELNRNPNWIIQLLKQHNVDFDKLNNEIKNEINSGNIIPFKLEDLFVNIYGLCAFPVVTKEILLEFFFEQNNEKLSQFLESRKTSVKRILRNWLKPD